MTHVGQASTYLRPSSHWPMTLAAVGKASHQGTSVSVKVLRNRPAAGQVTAIAASAIQRARTSSRRTCKAEPSSWVPRNHCHQPHAAITAKKICRLASPYSLLFQNNSKYSSEPPMAQGQPSGLTRMLHTTIASESTNATSSSQVTGEPQSVKALANQGCSVCSKAVIGMGLSRRRAAPRRLSAPLGGRNAVTWGPTFLALGRRNLDVDLVRLDHAQLETRFLFDHFQAFFQVADLGRQSVIARVGRFVLGLLQRQLGLQIHRVRHAALAEPQLGMYQHDQCEQGQGDKTHGRFRG